MILAVGHALRQVAAKQLKAAVQVDGEDDRRQGQDEGHGHQRNGAPQQPVPGDGFFLCHGGASFGGRFYNSIARRGADGKGRRKKKEKAALRRHFVRKWPFLPRKSIFRTAETLEK